MYQMFLFSRSNNDLNLSTINGLDLHAMSVKWFDPLIEPIHVGPELLRLPRRTGRRFISVASFSDRHHGISLLFFILKGLNTKDFWTKP